MDPNAACQFGHTALHNASITGSPGAVEALLAAGADPDLRYTKQSPIDGRVEAFRTALMYAKSAEVVDVLVKHGADPNVGDASGLTPLMLAAFRADLEVSRALLAAGANPRSKRAGTKKSPLTTAREIAEWKLDGYRKWPKSDVMDARMAEATAVIEELAAAEPRFEELPVPAVPADTKVAVFVDARKDAHVQFITEMLNGVSAEAQSWLNGGGEKQYRSLGEMSAVESQALVNGLYEAGAMEVLAVRIDQEEDYENTGHLLLKLPPKKAIRKKLFKLEAKQAKSQGYEGSEDWGQEYLYWKLD
jgi:hypothetical protein